MSKKKKREIPFIGEGIIETHCHLDYLKEGSLDDILEKAQKKGIEKIITISVSPENLSTVREISSKYSFIYCTQGLHPHEASKWSVDCEKEILENLSNPKVVAVGEIGLDFHYNHSKKDDQIKVFKLQMQMAIEHNLPVVIHSREADQEMIDVLNEMSPKLKRKGVIHSFTSGVDLAKCALSHGFHLGFNGIITFKTAENVREVAKLCPLDRILVETDAPFLTPIPYRGVENAPYYLPFVLEKIAEIKEVPVQIVLEKTSHNAKELFSFSQ